MPSIYAIYAVPCMLPYFGSTTETLSQRRAKHKGHYRRWKEGAKRGCTAFDLFDAVGFDACMFEVVEELPEDCSKEQRLIRERWWIENHVCVNKNRPIRTDEERIEQMRQYHAEHRDEHTEQMRQRYVEHRDEIIERSRQYNTEHRDEYNEYQRQYHIANRAKILERQRLYRARKKAEKAEVVRFILNFIPSKTDL